MIRHGLPRALFIALSFLISPLWAGGSITADTQEMLDLIKREWPRLNLTEDEVGLAAGWKNPFQTPSIEKCFTHPWKAPRQAARWLQTLESTPSLSGIFGVGSHILNPGESPAVQKNLPQGPAPPENLPAALKPILFALYGAIAQAQPLVNQAVDSVSSEARTGFLSLYDVPRDDSGLIYQEISSRRIKKKFSNMKLFDQKSMLRAGALIHKSLDQVVPPLTSLLEGEKSQETFTWTSPKEWETPLGRFLIGGKGDDTYTEENLKNVLCLIETGGANHYLQRAAVGREKEIRLVLDFGADVQIDSPPDGMANAATGIFGIGILYLANPSGKKTISSASFSQGCGVGGIGSLFVNGESIITGDRYAQGVGIFGVGLLRARKGSNSTYLLTRNGQGAGFVRGVGMFLHEGDNAVIEGGMVTPDPREPKGAVSLCQGVGFGRRAYSGGGAGIALIEGNHMTVESSYFAQGCGYWHSQGIFRFKGNDSRIQARRYDQGTGVHYAFGHFHLQGNHNRLLNWGVGPAYGWDHSLGTALVEGDGNEIQAEWGTGSAMIGSRSFSLIKGEKNKLKLPQFGTGHFFQNDFGYAIHLIQGKENRLFGRLSFPPSSPSTAPIPSALNLMKPNPWGLVKISGVIVDAKLHLIPPQWKKLPREKERRRVMVNLKDQLAKAEKKTGEVKLAEMVDVAGAFSLDKKTPREALEKLLSLPSTEIPTLLDVVEPEAVDQLIRLQVILPAYGEEMVKAILEKEPNCKSAKKSFLMGTLGLLQAEIALPELMKPLRSSQEGKNSLLWRKVAARILGNMFNRDTGNEPGRRAALKALSATLERHRSARRSKAAAKLLQKLRLPDAFGILSLSKSLKNEDRLAFLKTIPEDITVTIGQDAAEKLLALVHADAKTSLSRIQNELTVLNDGEPRLRKELYTLLKSTQETVALAGMISLGQIANPADVARLTPFLHHEKAALRKAAVVALSRMGRASTPVFEELLSSTQTARRTLALSAIPHAITKESLRLLLKGIRDPDENVRLTALSTVNQLPPVLEPYRKKIRRAIKRQLRVDQNADTRFAELLLVK